MTRSSLVVACRGLAATTFAAGLLALASGCSAGQITQTDQTVPAVPGVNLQTPVPGGRLSIRNAVVAYPGPQGYPAGGTAPLALRIVNESPRPIRLIGGTSPDGRLVVAGPPGSVAGTASPSPTPSPSTSVRPAATASARPAGSAPASPSPGSASPAPPPSATAASISVNIPPDGLVILDQNAPQRLQLVGLTRPVRPGESVTLTLAFSDGVTLADVSVPVDVPSSPASRVPAAPDPEGRED